MKYKGILLICLLLILSITAVSAADSNNGTEVSTDVDSLVVDDGSFLKYSEIHDSKVFSNSTDTFNNLQTGKNSASEESVSELTEGYKSDENIGNTSIRFFDKDMGIQNSDMSVGNIIYVNSTQDGGDGKTPQTAYKTLSDAIENSCDGDTIMIASGTYVGQGVNVDLKIEKQLTLIKYGNEGAIFDGQELYRIFTISAPRFNIFGLTFQNGRAVEGGAIIFTRDIYYSNIVATFINNIAEYNGGAIYFNNGVSNLNIDSVFINNTATYRGGANYFDGYVSDSIVSGQFINNRVTMGHGGANMFTNVFNTTISGKYVNNSAYYDGVNFFWYDASNLNITGEYMNNTVHRNGINCFYGTVSDSNISGVYMCNSVLNGAIIRTNSPSNVFISNSIFLSNENKFLFYADKSGAVAKDNWFGDIFDSSENFPVHNVEMPYWLYLDTIIKDNAIEFTLKRYFSIKFIIDNEISYWISKMLGFVGDRYALYQFDNVGQLPKVNFTLTPVNMAIDKKRVSFNENVNYKIINEYNAYIFAEIGNITIPIHFEKGNFDLLQEIINAAPDNGVINLTRNYTYSKLDSITNGILINKNLTINGNGFTIDASCKSRIFDVYSSTFNLYNITLINGRRDGGAILFHYNMTNSNINANFCNCVANSYGGAIFVVGDMINSKLNGQFIDNSAYYGGAILVLGEVKNTEISGSFIKNSAYYGGAINIQNIYNLRINGQFLYNSAYCGGAIFVSDIPGKTFNMLGTKITIPNFSKITINGQFLYNSAYYGGAIFSRNMYEIYVSTVNFTDNSAFYRGGAIYLLNTSKMIMSGNFVNNFAGDGGVSYFDGNTSDVWINGYFSNNIAMAGSIITFCNPTSAVAGSFIPFCKSTSYIKISNSIFLDNQFTNNIIYANGTGVVANNNWFGNNATNYNIKPNVSENVELTTWIYLNATEDMICNILYAVKFHLMAYDSSNQKIACFNSALLPKINLNITAINAKIDLSYPLLDHQLLYAPISSQISVTAQIGTVNYTIVINRGDFDLLQQLINDASDNGIINLERDYSYTEFDTITKGIVITKNNLTINGNGFTIDAKFMTGIFDVHANSINIINITLKNGKSDFGGAIVFNDNLINSVINATFINNIAMNGGAIFSKNKVSNSIITGQFIKNTAEKSGGAISINASNTSISGSFINNSAMEGGAINIIGKSKLTNINFTGNIANSGGSICAYDDLIIENANFKDNKAENGANNIVLKGEANLTVYNVTPQSLGPFKAVNIKIVGWVSADDIDKLIVEVSCDDKPMNNGMLKLHLTKPYFDYGPYFANVENGTAILEIPKLFISSGEYTGNIIFDGELMYTNGDISFSIVIG